MITKRSISIAGSVTSISLESVFWDELDRQAAIQGIAWQNHVRTILADNIHQTNRSSAIRERLLMQLREELLRIRKKRQESWWTLYSPGGTQEVGTRGSILFAGRDAGNDFALDDAEVSRRHLMLGYDGENWWAVDLDSKNGMSYRGKKTLTVKLEKGISLLLGKSELVLVG